MAVEQRSTQRSHIGDNRRKRLTFSRLVLPAIGTVQQVRHTTCGFRATMSSDVRVAIREIVSETKTDLPAYWQHSHAKGE